MFTSTQVNANADDNKNIRNESSLAGSRAIINKADVGAIMARPTKEELEVLKDASSIFPHQPNIVTDIYKITFFARRNICNSNIYLVDTKFIYSIKYLICSTYNLNAIDVTSPFIRIIVDNCYNLCSILII